MDEDADFDKSKKNRKPRKIMRVNPSKYESAEAIHTNKKYWKAVFDQLDAAAAETIEESRRISKVLPNRLYESVCNSLNLPVVREDQEESLRDKGKPVRRLLKKPMLSNRTCLYIDREMESDTDVEFYPSDDGEEEPPDFMELLSKPEREQITWATRYLQPEREEDKSLIRKADDLTDRIATEFCKYMKELGGDQQSHLFTPKAIKELFQIEFDTHVARGVRVVPKELPCVDEKIANITGYPEKSREAALERQITWDIAAERRPTTLRAFGHSLPLADQWRAPANNTKDLWRSAQSVPRDLVTLKTVWEGITNLRSDTEYKRTKETKNKKQFANDFLSDNDEGSTSSSKKSVKEYCRWMIEHPEHRRAPYLSSLGMFDPAVLEARLTFEAQCGVSSPIACPDEAPAPIDHIRKRLSELADTTD